MEGWNFWWGIAAFFLGGLATQLNGWLAYRRQRKDRADDAADALRQRREEFELQHLVEVNQLLRNLMDAFFKVVVAGTLQARYGRQSEDEELQVQLHDGHVSMAAAEDALHAQVGFILDDEVRRLVNEAVAAIEYASTTPAAREPDDLHAMGGKVNAAFEAVTARVRALYAGRVTP